MAEEATAPAQAQPNGGQGQAADNGAGMYAELLTGIPQEQHASYIDVLKRNDARITRQQQQAADYRQQWEPFEQHGLGQYQPEQLAQAMQIVSMLQDEDQARELTDQLGEHYGWWPDENDDDGDGQVDTSQFDPQAFRDEMVAEFQQLMEQREQDQAMQTQADQQVDAKLTELQIPDTDQELVLRLASTLPDELGIEALTKAWEQVQQIRGQAQKSLVDDKLAQPEQAENGGRPAVAKEPIRSFQDADRAARSVEKGLRSLQ